MIIEIADVDVVFNQGIPIVESCDRYDSPVGLQSLLSISDGLYIVQSDVDLESGRISEINLNVVERLFGLDRVEIKATFYVYGDEWVSSRIGYQNSIEFLMNHVHKPEVFAYLRTARAGKAAGSDRPGNGRGSGRA